MESAIAQEESRSPSSWCSDSCAGGQGGSEPRPSNATYKDILFHWGFITLPQDFFGTKAPAWVEEIDLKEHEKAYDYTWENLWMALAGFEAPSSNINTNTYSYVLIIIFIII